jgi:hypothetical protein
LCIYWPAGGEQNQPAAAVREAFFAGIQDFAGENYLQELLDKQIELSDLPLTWHHWSDPVERDQSYRRAPRVHQ